MYPPTNDRRARPFRGRKVNGRDYFLRAERELHIENLDAASVQEKSNSGGLPRGPSESRVGGRITRDLKRLSPEETAERRRRSEEFLKRPATDFPAENAQRGDVSGGREQPDHRKDS